MLIECSQLLKMSPRLDLLARRHSNVQIETLERGITTKIRRMSMCDSITVSNGLYLRLLRCAIDRTRYSFVFQEINRPIRQKRKRSPSV